MDDDAFDYEIDLGGGSDKRLYDEGSEEGSMY